MTGLMKEEAVKIVESLPDDATWEDLMYAIYVRQAVEEGLAESDAGLGMPVEEVGRRFGLEK
jgi:hypothetical protein